jgi:hypothetical protein
MYAAIVILLLLVLPVASIGIEATLAEHPLSLMFLTGKWFVFWGVGIRLLLAGARQAIQPRFTAKEIFRIDGAESLPIVRELGFANLSMGTLGICSLFQMSWTVPAAIVGALYYGLAGLGHIGQKEKNAKEYIAMVSDGFMFLLISVFIASRTHSF